MQLVQTGRLVLIQWNAFNKFQEVLENEVYSGLRFYSTQWKMLVNLNLILSRPSL
jgi:hypothetical protein